MGRRDVSTSRLLSRALDAHDRAIKERRGVHVWWDLDRDLFMLVPVDCVMGRLLSDRLDADALRAFVGTFEAPCTTAQIRAAMEAHLEGRIVL